MKRRAFSLVELLVVIGIIALLIAILLPTLVKARQAAQRTICLTKLQQIIAAANIHVVDHKGFYPISGVVPGCFPSDLDDAYAQKYDYFTIPNGTTSTAPGQYLEPLTHVLKVIMGWKFNQAAHPGESEAQVADDDDNTRSNSLRNLFCPSQCSTVQEFLALEPWVSWNVIVQQPESAKVAESYTVAEVSSYVFNEYVIGFNDGWGRLRGHATQVRKPAQTFFACDGLGDPGLNPARGDITSARGATGTYGCYSIYNNYPFPGDTYSLTPEITLGDVLSGKSYDRVDPAGGSPACFDSRRHQGKMNIAFCDGHVETRNLTANDLSNVYLVAH